MADVHRIDLEALDLEDAEALEAAAAQYRALLTEAQTDDVRAQLEGEAERAEAEAERLRANPPHRGQWVDLRPRRTYGDRMQINSARVRDEVTGERILRTIDPVAFTFAKLDRAIDGWSVAWWNGNIPARQAIGISDERRAALDEIDEDIGPRLVAAVDDFYASQKRSDADTKG